MRLTSWFCLAFALLASNAIPNTGTLKGVVRGQGGVVAPYIMIRAMEWDVDSNGKPHLAADITVYADDNGKYSIKLAPGLYDVFVSHVAFSPYAKKIKIEPEKETILSPELEFSPLVEIIE